MKMLKLGSLVIHPITSDMLVESWVVALDSHIYQADALQITSARALRSDLFLAVDVNLLEAAESGKLEAFNVESEADRVNKALEVDEARLAQKGTALQGQ